MNKRSREIRKRVEKRKRERTAKHSSYEPLISSTDEERYGQPVITYDRYSIDDKHPLFRKEVFLLKTFLSACLVLVTAIARKDICQADNGARISICGCIEMV